MPLPILFMGIAATSGAIGVGKSVKASIDAFNAHSLNKSANEIVDDATKILNEQRRACSNSLSQLGNEKMFVLGNSMTQFLDTFTKIKNVDFRQTEGLDELERFHIDEQEFQEMKSMVNYAASMAGGAIAGTAGGTLTAIGAYSAAQAFATASTGTAIATLHGAAATNATMAFFGGGSLASGGLGMAGGVFVLGSLVAGPALAVMGLVAGAAANKNLEQARTNKSEATMVSSQLYTASLQCETIRRRTYMFYNLLARLDAYFVPLIYKMEDIVKAEGDDYRNYSTESKKSIASCASVAVSVKSVLDTPILTDEGLLTRESEGTATDIEDFLKNMKIPY